MAEAWLVHTLVFDLDDTLYPEREFALSGFAAVEAWLQAKHHLGGFLERARLRFGEGLRGNIFDVVLAELGINPTADMIQQLVRVYREHEPRLRMFPDAMSALSWGRQAFNLGLITDGYAGVQARKIRALGLESIIEFRVITDELGREYWKPHPEAYQRVMQRFQGVGHGYVYIADNPKKDFIAPRQLGWKTIRIRRSGGEYASCIAASGEDADCEIASLETLNDLLRPLR